MAEEQRKRWRSVVMLGIALAIVTVLALIPLATVLDLNAKRFDSSMAREADPLGINPSGSEYPLGIAVGILIFVVPFTLGGFTTMMLSNVLIVERHWIARQFSVALSGVAMGLAILIAFSYMFAFFYAKDTNEEETAAVIGLLFFLTYNLVTHLVMFCIVGSNFVSGVLPRSLVWVLFVLAMLAFVLNILATHPDLPGLRLLAGFFFQVVWREVLVSFMWFASMPPQVPPSTATRPSLLR